MPALPSEAPDVLLIRPVGAPDIAALTELNGYVQSIHVAQRPDVFFESSPADVVEWFVNRLLVPDSRAWIAEVGGVPVGYLLLIHHTRSKSPFSRARRFAEIDQIGVHPEFRDRGIGSALIEKALDDVRSAGVGSVELSTWAFNDDAGGFVQQRGFAPMTTKWQRLL